MYYIDSHAHITSEFYSDIEKIIENSKKENVLKIINCADDINSSYEIIKLQSKYPNIFYGAIGIHPENVSKINDTDVQKLEQLIKTNKVYAIGEIGLDYHYDSYEKENQIKILKKQLFLAKKYNLPVIIHSRDANKDIIEILKKFKLKGVFHSFKGTKMEAYEIIKMGFVIGINGIITFKNAEEERKVLKDIPLDKIILETDSPFLTPNPFRKLKNEPKYISNIGKYVASIYDKTETEVLYTTTKNVIQLFDLNG